MFESKWGIVGIAGVFFFAFAMLSNVLVPIAMYWEMPEKSVAELVNPAVMYHFEDLSERYPEPFKEAFGEPSKENCAQAMLLGRHIYVAEGCWHCHSQFVRPVSNETKRWGPVSESEEYQNELQRPVMFGTRRVGPDLSHEGGRRSNDWHAVHFFKPQMVSAESPMPRYPWLYGIDPETNQSSPNYPTKRGLALITYVQWLGSNNKTYPYYEDYKDYRKPGATDN